MDRRRAAERWHRYGGRLLDLPLAVLIFAASLLPVFHDFGTRLGGVPDRPFDALAVAAIALQCFPLAVRGRWPLASCAVVACGFAVDQLGGYHSPAGVALPIALISVASRVERHRAATVLVLSAAYVPLAVGLHLRGPGTPPSGFAALYLALAVSWAMGAWLRSTRAAEAERRARAAAETRAAERGRIARELHDVVTHHVTAMVVQAEASRYLTATPDRLDQALATVSATGRRAISDLRHLLDLLDPDYSGEVHAPSAGGLRTLVEQTRRAGQPVEFAEEGTPAESAGSADLVAYRVVQEALTNALKYAHGSPTTVRVRHGLRDITVEVGTEGTGGRVGLPEGDGRGLAGLRERVDVLGGDFAAGTATGGGFTVRARIPAGTPS
jgi:signal transduction histidine kinase